ncbi:hypothetical protein HPB47_001648, partial [Ixodes persulcatus]
MTDEELKENLSLQLAEIEMLTSMYPGNDEFKLLSPAAVSEFQDFIDGKTSSVQTSLDVSFKIATESNKRRLILECGTRDSLSGFCLPGKPGIICFEGPSSECLEAWSVIKNQTWQRIGLKHQEDFLVTEGQSVDSLRKFHKFAELAFNTKQNASRDHHMDMGEFLKFLKERN